MLTTLYFFYARSKVGNPLSRCRGSAHPALVLAALMYKKLKHNF